MPVKILSISLDESQILIEKVVELAKKDGKKPVAVGVVGIDGRLVAFAAMDGVMPMSINIAQNKAYSAIIGGRDTALWEKREPPIDSRNFTDERFTALPGGVLIEHEGMIIGAIGVSGRSSQEDVDLIKEAYQALC